MRSDVAIIVASWIAITVIAVVYIYVAGVNFWSNIMLLFLLAIAFVITFGVHHGSPLNYIEATSNKKLLEELAAMKKELMEVKELVQEVKRILEE